MTALEYEFLLQHLQYFLPPFYAYGKNNTILTYHIFRIDEMLLKSVASVAATNNNRFNQPANDRERGNIKR